MTNNNAILSTIKLQIKNVVPDAKVMLFGSRAYGTPTEESDWDILILSKGPVNFSLKNQIHSAIYPVSVQIGSFINFIAVQEKEWETSPSYYTLQKSISNRMIEI
jgi:DNA polymerase sigma